MNVQAGGSRLLATIGVLLGAGIGIVTMVFPIPLGAEPLATAEFQQALWSAGVGAGVVLLIAYRGMEESNDSHDNLWAAMKFIACLWGMACGAGAWLLTVYLAWGFYFGTWSPPFDWMAQGRFAPGIGSALVAGAMFIVPVLLITPIVWLFGGFLKPKGAA